MCPLNAIKFLTSTFENDVLIPKCNLLHNGTSQRGFQLKDGLRLIWNRAEQMDSAIIDAVLAYEETRQAECTVHRLQTTSRVFYCTAGG